MISVLAILLTVSFYLTPVYSDLPKVNGRPLLIDYIEDWMGTDQSKVFSNAEDDMKKWGIDELKQYCKFLSTGNQNYVQECVNVNDIYEKICGDRLFVHFWQDHHFSDLTVSTSLNGYLTEIGKNMKEKGHIEKHLIDAIIENGWKQLKEFCSIDENKKKEEACKLHKIMAVENWKGNKSKSGPIYRKFLWKCNSNCKGE